MIFPRIVVVALAVASVTVTSGCTTRAHDRYGYSERHHGDSDNPQVSFDFGTVGVGYSDGYWDNGHQWHSWDNDNERDSYRHRDGSHYNDWNHDRDGDDSSRGH